MPVRRPEASGMAESATGQTIVQSFSRDIKSEAKPRQALILIIAREKFRLTIIKRSNFSG